MKVVVTGGSGNIGRYVVRELLQYGHEIVSFDRICTAGAGTGRSLSPRRPRGRGHHLRTPRPGGGRGTSFRYPFTGHPRQRFCLSHERNGHPTTCARLLPRSDSERSSRRAASTCSAWGSAIGISFLTTCRWMRTTPISRKIPMDFPKWWGKTSWTWCIGAPAYPLCLSVRRTSSCRRSGRNDLAAMEAELQRLLPRHMGLHGRARSGSRLSPGAGNGRRRARRVLYRGRRRLLSDATRGSSTSYLSRHRADGRSPHRHRIGYH